LGTRGLVCKSGPDLRALDLESVCVRSRLCESEVDELKHRFQVLARGIAGQALFGFSDKGADIGNLARHYLSQVDGAELPDTAGAEDLRSSTGGDVIGIPRQRGGAPACRPGEGLIFPQRRPPSGDLLTPP